MLSWAEVKPPCSFNRCQRFFASFHFKDLKSSRCVVFCSNSIVSCHLAVCDIRCIPEHKCGRSDETDSSSSKQCLLDPRPTWLFKKMSSLTSREDFQQVNPPLKSCYVTPNQEIHPRSFRCLFIPTLSLICHLKASGTSRARQELWVIVTPLANELAVTRAQQFLCCRGTLFSLFSLFDSHAWVIRLIIIIIIIS